MSEDERSMVDVHQHVADIVNGLIANDPEAVGSVLDRYGCCRTWAFDDHRPDQVVPVMAYDGYAEAPAGARTAGQILSALLGGQTATAAALAADLAEHGSGTDVIDALETILATSQSLLRSVMPLAAKRVARGDADG